MKHKFASLAILAACLITRPAHASTLDDFTLVGEGHTITFSLPDSTTIQDHPHIVSLGADAAATIDGVSGYTEAGTFFLPFLNPPSMTFTVPSTIDGGELTLYGQYLLSFIIIPISDPSEFHPDDILTTFVPGTYSLTENSVFFPSAPYTLTITPEVTSATPEPASLTLLATGSLSLLGFALRYRRAAQVSTRSPQCI
jgi:hypothetical protein